MSQVLQGDAIVKNNADQTLQKRYDAMQVLLAAWRLLCSLHSPPDRKRTKTSVKRGT
jgi:hypothetical protein